MSREAPTLDELYGPGASDAEALVGEPRCTWCGEPLSDEDVENPEKDSSGDVICDECHREHYTYVCCACKEDDETKYQHNMVVVFDPEAAGVPGGIYRITRFPYYSLAIIGGGCILRHAVERIADVPKEWGHDYPCGHLCRECQREV